MTGFFIKSSGSKPFSYRTKQSSVFETLTVPLFVGVKATYLINGCIGSSLYSFAEQRVEKSASVVWL